MVSGTPWIQFLNENNLKKVNRFTQRVLNCPEKKKLQDKCHITGTK